MARYVSLLRFTPQGVKNLKQSPARAAAFCKVAEKAGVQVEMQLWTTGAYDGILILNAASEVKASERHRPAGRHRQREHGNAASLRREGIRCDRGPVARDLRIICHATALRRGFH